MPKGHGGDSLTNPDVRLLSQPGRTPTYHVGSDLVGCIPIQVKFECHHFVVVRLQLALHHLVTRVAYLQDTREMRTGRRLHPANPVPASPPHLSPHIQDGQPGPAGPLLAGAHACGPAVVFPGRLAFQLPPTKRAFTAVTQLSSRSDVGSSIAAGKLRMLMCPRKQTAIWPHLGSLAFQETPEDLT